MPETLTLNSCDKKISHTCHIFIDLLHKHSYICYITVYIKCQLMLDGISLTQSHTSSNLNL